MRCHPGRVLGGHCLSDHGLFKQRQGLLESGQRHRRIRLAGCCACRGRQRSRRRRRVDLGLQSTRTRSAVRSPRSGLRFRDVLDAARVLLHIGRRSAGVPPHGRRVYRSHRRALLRRGGGLRRRPGVLFGDQEQRADSVLRGVLYGNVHRAGLPRQRGVRERPTVHHADVPGRAHGSVRGGCGVRAGLTSR